MASRRKMFLAFGNDNAAAVVEARSLDRDVTLTRSMSGDFANGDQVTFNFWLKLKTGYPSVQTKLIGDPNMEADFNEWFISINPSGQLVVQVKSIFNTVVQHAIYTSTGSFPIGSFHQVTVIFNSVGATQPSDFWKVYIDGTLFAGTVLIPTSFAANRGANMDWAGPLYWLSGIVTWYIKPGTLNALMHDISYLQHRALLPSAFVDTSGNPIAPVGAVPLNGDAYFKITDGTLTSTFTNTQTLV